MEESDYLIKRTVRKVIKDIEKKNGGINKQIKSAWKEVIKEKLLNETQIVNFQESTLKVKVRNSSCLYRLNFSKRSIIKKMNKKIGGQLVKKIEFFL